MPDIDIIIPAYKAQNTIAATLSSITMQTIADRCRVTICNDCDGIGYEEYVKAFSSILDVREIVLPQNGGPGVARQYGIDNTSAPFIMFVDADDTFESAYSVEFMLGEMSKYDNAHSPVCTGNFIESITMNGKAMFVLHKQENVWVFAKIYRRAFLDKYGITFNETRANEDVGFNTLIELCADKEEKQIYLDNTVYCWHFNPSSITRKDNFDYNFNASIVGYTENMMDAIYRANKTKGSTAKIVKKIIEVMVNLYISFVEIIAKDSRYREKALNCCKEFYQLFFSQVANQVEEEIVIHTVQNFLDDKQSRLKGFIPEYTYNQFINLMKGE